MAAIAAAAVATASVTAARNPRECPFIQKFAHFDMFVDLILRAHPLIREKTLLDFRIVTTERSKAVALLEASQKANEAWEAFQKSLTTEEATMLPEVLKLFSFPRATRVMPRAQILTTVNYHLTLMSIESLKVLAAQQKLEAAISRNAGQDETQTLSGAVKAASAQWGGLMEQCMLTYMKAMIEQGENVLVEPDNRLPEEETDLLRKALAQISNWWNLSKLLEAEGIRVPRDMRDVSEPAIQIGSGKEIYRFSNRDCFFSNYSFVALQVIRRHDINTYWAHCPSIEQWPMTRDPSKHNTDVTTIKKELIRGPFQHGTVPQMVKAVVDALEPLRRCVKVMQASKGRDMSVFPTLEDAEEAVFGVSPGAGPGKEEGKGN